MKIETKRAYQEVYVILEQMPKEYVDKLPDKMKELIEYSRDKSYKPKLDLNKDLSKQNISDKAVNILAVLYYKYWTLSDVEKKELYDFLMMETEKNRKKFKVQQGDSIIEEKPENEYNRFVTHPGEFIPVDSSIKEQKGFKKYNEYVEDDKESKEINEKKEYIPHPNYYPVVKQKKSFFRKLLDKLKSIFGK